MRRGLVEDESVGNAEKGPKLRSWEFTNEKDTWHLRGV